MAGKRTKTGTYAAIAERCGVSVMTVSRAFRENSSVRASTRKRVLSAAAEMGYQANPGIGRPRLAPTAARPVVDVVVGTKANLGCLFYSDLLLILEQELSAHGHDCVIRSCSTEYEPFTKLVDVMRTSQARGTLLLGYFDVAQLQVLLEIDADALLLDNPGDSALMLPYSSLAFDNAEAARVAVTHLLNRGAERILLMKGFADHYFSREIETGYREALGVAGRDADAGLIVSADFTTSGARELVRAVLANEPAFDAVFTNDEMACGVLQALREAGLDVPGDVRVVGCDGLPVGEQVSPRLTTVALDYRELGRLAVERLLTRDERSCRMRTRLVPELVIRDSCGDG